MNCLEVAIVIYSRKWPCMNCRILFSVIAMATIMAFSRVSAYEPPKNDPFQLLIEEIDKNVAPILTPVDSVNIKGNKGETSKSITGGSEVVDDVMSCSYPYGTTVKKSVSVKHVTFKSVPVYKDGAFHDDTVVYAQIAMPTETKVGDKLPGILILHGGEGFIQSGDMYHRVLRWAAAGYVVVACDLPGIASPDGSDAGSGTWKSVRYSNIPRFPGTPDIKKSWIFTAEATALKAFAVLIMQPNVDPSKIGIVGISWGGYSTTMLCGLLGNRVAAGFSVFGCGFFDEDSAWQPWFLPDPSADLYKNDIKELAQWKSEGARQWLTYLDAGRRAGNIKTNFYLAAAANDHFFRPAAVVKTLQAITGAASLNFQFSPNSQVNPRDSDPLHNIGYYCVQSSHKILTPGGSLIPPNFVPPPIERGWVSMEAIYFDYLLKGVGAPLSEVKLAGAPELDSTNNLNINFDVTSDASVRLKTPKLYYSLHTTNDTWEKRNWIELGVPMKETEVVGKLHRYSVAMPANIAAQNIDWYVLASDTRGAWATTTTTLVYNWEGIGSSGTKR